jgi:DNA-binding NtrC family response regulator
LRKALIVDDDTSILRNFSRLLRENGYEVCAVTTAKDAITKLSEEGTFDLLLLDYVLPDMDGLKILETVGSKVSDSVKIMITGFPTLRETSRAFDLGIDSYIEKPIDAENLLSLIEQLTEKKTKK